MKSENIHIYRGIWASAFFLFVSMFLICYGAFLLYRKNDIAYYFIPIGIAILIPQKGVSLNFSKERFQEHVSFLGLRIGSWKSLRDYPAITVVQQKKRLAFFQFAGSLPTNFEQTFSNFTNYNVVLLSKNHRNKFVLKSFSTAEKAKQFAKMIAKNGAFEYEKYNPILSARSLQNRQRGLN